MKNQGYNQSISTDLIYDVGAHKGEDSDFYLKLGYRVVAVEANPGLVEGLQARFSKEIQEGRYTVIDKAIGAEAGTISFFINKQVSVWGTADPAWANRNQALGAESEQITVQSVKFADVIKNHGCPHYLKIDVEGADMLCVTALKEISCRPNFLSIESSKTSWKALLNEFDVLEDLGYTRFAVIDQRNHGHGVFTNQAGKTSAHVFEEGATGPFGTDVRGAWLTKRQAIRRYVPIFIKYKLMGDNTFLEKMMRRSSKLRRLLGGVGWYDTHARRD